MSNQILLRADTHCHPHAGSSKRAIDCLQALQWSYQTALDRGCKWVVDLGDVFHERHHIDTWTYVEVYKMAKAFKERGVNTLFVLGNHDMYFRDSTGHNAIMAFESMFRVVVDPTVVDLCGRPFDCFPYVEKNPQRVLEQVFPDKRSDVLFFHAAFDGAVMSSASGMRRKKGSGTNAHDMHEDEVAESIDPNGLTGWKFAWGGHYHLPQVFSETPCHAEYVGSLLQHNRGETGERKRVVLMDVDTLATQDIYNTESPVFLKIDGDAPLDIPSDVNVAKARIYVYTADLGSAQVSETCRTLRKMGALQVLIEPKDVAIIDREVQTQGIRGAASMITDGDSMIRRFVKMQAPADLETSRLVGVGQKIMRCADTGVFEE